MTLPIPQNAMAQHVILLGKTRSGKSSVMRLLVESLLGHGKPVCIIDPKGDWWGLKSSASGKRAGFQVIIFGGEHADIPINEHSGAAVAELIATGNRPCIIDLGGWMVGARTRFFVDFASALFRLTRGPRWLVIDEVHNFAPQGKVLDPDAGKMLHWANRLASEGAGKGITLISASQRPQKVHKDFVTSNETLIAMRVIHKLDRDAVEDWIDGCADPAKGKEVVATLAGMKRGQGWVWSPEIGFGPVCIQFPMFSTYDSFKAPTGEAVEKLKGWASVDLDDVRTKLAAVVEEAKANDPKVLQAEVRRLTADLAKASRQFSQPVEKINTAESARTARALEAAISAAKMEGLREGFADAISALRTTVAGVLNGTAEAVERAVSAEMKARAGALERAFGAAKIPKRQAVAALPGPIVPRGTFPIHAPVALTAHPRRAPVALAARTDAQDGVLTAPQRRVMASLAFWRSIGHDAPTRDQVAAVAGYRPGSGNFNNLVGGLSSAGLTTVPSPGCLSLLADYPSLTQQEAQTKLWGIFKAPQRRLVEAALAAAADLSRDELASNADYSPGSGNFNNICGSLTSMDVLQRTGQGRVGISDWARVVLS